ncbi:MAG: lipocalin-like domain-containing protein [Prevotella sp.]|jgi:hypothetical protein|nr:lipocalin-like domain-containing protein [Prevotella sp.]
MRRFFYLSVFIAVTLLLFSSCDDYLETGIEGQWQMTKIVKADGSEQSVDTIYYLFKKGVFKYLWMKTDLEPHRVFGLYSEHNGKLDLNVSDSWTSDWDLKAYFGASGLGWEAYDDDSKYKRTYNIKRTSSALELEFEGDRYIFRKY